MKLSKKILAALSAATLLATTALFSSCSDDEDDDNKNGTVYATLPESVGENQLKGKTWKYQYTSNEKEYSHSWSFTDTTATYTNSKNDYQDIYTYKYSYDANQNLLYLALQSEGWTEDGETISWSSVEECIELMKKWYEEAWESLSEAGKEVYIEATKDDFSTLEVRKYTIGEDNSLTLKDYFDGNLPTACHFRKEIAQRDLPSEYTNGEISLNGIMLDSKDSSLDSDYLLSFNSASKTFSGNMYTLETPEGEDLGDATKLGAVTGTYTTEGTGTSGCKVTLTFTEIPGGVSVIKTNTAYELEMDSDSDTYTLVK